MISLNTSCIVFFKVAAQLCHHMPVRSYYNFQLIAQQKPTSCASMTSHPVMLRRLRFNDMWVYAPYRDIISTCSEAPGALSQRLQMASTVNWQWAPVWCLQKAERVTVVFFGSLKWKIITSKLLILKFETISQDKEFITTPFHCSTTQFHVTCSKNFL